MRVIAGRFGGRRLEAPRGRDTRPTSDRVREALFSILGPLAGVSSVLDLFAGSGALGIEALSRGAERAVFVDADPRAVASVRRNLAALGLEAPVVRRDALAFLQRDALASLQLGAPAASDRPAGAPAAGFDLVFVDPPYSCGPRMAAALSERLAPVLAEDARIVSESHKRAPLELPLPQEDERLYGDTRIAIFRAH